jgi:tetratricopeptide (TPR) repeat protein
MITILGAGSLVALSLIPGVWRGDVVILKTGERLECLIVDVDERQVRVRRGSEGVSEFRQISRSDVTDIQLATPDVTGFRSVARRFESDRWVREATDVWRQVCVLRPESAQDQLKLAQSYRRAGKLEDAAAAALAAAKGDPRDAKVPMEQGEIALALGDGAAAVRFAREAFRLSSPEPEGARWLLARALEGAGLAEDALGEYARLLRADPRATEVLERYVALSLNAKKAEAAVEELTRVTRSAPEQRTGWISLGRLLYRLGRLPEAESAFRTATSLGGSDYNRARVYFQCTIARRYGRSPELVLNPADLKVAVDLDPSLRRESP